MKLTTVLMIAAVTMAMAAPASAATCTRADAQYGVRLIHKLESAARRFENAPIKNFCPAGIKLQKAARNADNWLQSHKQCLTSAADRRAVRDFHYNTAKLNSAIRKACGH